MRISAFKDSPFYMSPSLCGPVKVFLDGVERSGVMEADEEGRRALLVRRDEKGNVTIDLKTEQVRTDEFFGHVRIEAPDEVRRQYEENLKKPVESCKRMADLIALMRPRFDRIESKAEALTTGLPADSAQRVSLDLLRGLRRAWERREIDAVQGITLLSEQWGRLTELLERTHK